MKQTFDVVVIGGGPAGQAAALGASVKRRVALIDEYATAGQPTRKRGMMAAFARAVQSGDSFAQAQAAATGFDDDLTRQLPAKHALQAAGVAVITGRGQFVSDHEVTVGHDILAARTFVIASGSQLELPQLSGPQQPQLVAAIFRTSRQPQRLVSLGMSGGDVELYRALVALGTRITIIGTMEPTAAGSWQFIAGTIGSLERLQRSYQVNYQSGGSAASLGADLVVASAVRQPNLAIGLDEASIHYGETGIVADHHYQTTNARMYAIGSCLAPTYPRPEPSEQGRQLGQTLRQPGH